ncbi:MULTISPECIES: hypothetical protein [Pseudomonas]|uniref:hypothetical protein n=1 Tax=Pseudomonas TaxID=286 RepID=UPI0039900364
MPDPLSPPPVVDALQLRTSQLFALRPTLGTLGITQAQLDADPEAVLEYYAEQLIEFFCAPGAASETRWRELSQMLAQRLRKVLRKQADPVIRRLLQAVLAFPDSGERTSTIEVYGVQRHNDLALAIVGAGTTLIYSVRHGLEVFTSAQQAEVLVDAERLEHDVFEGWALCGLEAALQRIDAIDLSESPRLEPLDRQLAWATRFRDFFEQDPEPQGLRESLPSWLKEASRVGRLAYSRLLVRTAWAYQKYCARAQLDDLPEDDAAHQACFAREMAMDLCKVALEYSLQGLAGVTLEGYYRLRAAVRTYATHRHVQGEPMVFRRLADESGYLIGAGSDEVGPWLVFRPWSAQVFQQVMTAPASGAVLSQPFAEMFLTRKMLLASPFKAQVTQNAQVPWRDGVRWMRQVALLLVYPARPQGQEPASPHPRVKRLDAAWAGARQVLSAVQQHQLAAIAHPSKVGEMIHEGLHKGLHLFDNGLVYNKDENHFYVLSHIRISPVFNINSPVYQVVDRLQKPVTLGPDIISNDQGQWDIRRVPRLKRDVRGLSVRGRRAFDAGQASLARANQAEAETLRPGTPPVAAEEQFEQLARGLDDAARVLAQFTQSRSNEDCVALISQLRATALQLRNKGHRLRIDMIRTSQTPTVGDVEYLLGQRAICIRRINGRVPETIDGTVDYLQEYEVLDVMGGYRPLWYAHFHYPLLHTPPDQPSKAHLKLAAQRKMGRVFEQAERSAGRHSQVYRGPIGTPSGRRIFLDVM